MNVNQYFATRVPAARSADRTEAQEGGDLRLAVIAALAPWLLLLVATLLD